MLLRMATSDRTRRIQQLVAGIVALAAVIGLCVAALVVLFDRFTAHVGDACPERGCVTRHYACDAKGRAAVDDLVAVLRRQDGVRGVGAGGCTGGSAAVGFTLPGSLADASGVVRRAWDCTPKHQAGSAESGGREFRCESAGVRFDLDLGRSRAGGTGAHVAVEARPVR